MEDCIRIAKEQEIAWIEGHITTAEYHGLIDYVLRRLYEQEKKKS